jgi:hypothetical protein
MTDKFEPGNPLHEEIKHGVEVGDGLPPMYTIPQTIEAMKEARFDVVVARDMVDNGPNMIPWFVSLALLLPRLMPCLQVRHACLGRPVAQGFAHELGRSPDDTHFRMFLASRCPPSHVDFSAAFSSSRVLLPSEPLRHMRFVLLSCSGVSLLVPCPCCRLLALGSPAQILLNAADALVASGRLEIFTPMLLVVAVKPQ